MTWNQPRGFWGQDPLQPVDVEVIRNGAGEEVHLFSPFPITAPEPVAPAIQAGLRAGYDMDALDASTPIFQSLVREAVNRQVRYEEEQLREWLRALIENPAGRKLIEEML